MIPTSECDLLDWIECAELCDTVLARIAKVPNSHFVGFFFNSNFCYYRIKSSPKLAPLSKGLLYLQFTKYENKSFNLCTSIDILMIYLAIYIKIPCRSVVVLIFI